MSGSFQELIDKYEGLALDSTQAALEALTSALENKDPGTYEKHVVPVLASSALIYKGVLGVEALAQVLPRAPGYIYPTAILKTLWRASEGERPPKPTFGEVPEESILSLLPSEEIQVAARKQFVVFLEDCRTNPESFYRLINLLHQVQVESISDQASHERFSRSVFQVFADTALSLSDQHIGRFRSLLNQMQPEEVYHKFLAQNPVFLDPLASHVISKHKLGDDFITDYVLKRITGEYVAVEIEKPTDPIFTQANDFSASFTHAFGQVLDFIDWIEKNLAYAQTKLQGIVSPRGLLVIGMRSGLTDRQTEKLRRFARNSASVSIMTFDDLLENAEILHTNIRQRIDFNSAIIRSSPHSGSLEDI